MDLTGESLPTLAERLMAERKRQKLSREQAAAVCNVSTSFIRDAESDPARCSLGKLLLLMRGLGLSFIDNGAFSGGRQVRSVMTATGESLIQVDLNGDRTADLIISLGAGGRADADDFLL